MDTCIFYVDESGNPDRYNNPLKNGETPIFSLSALALPIDNWRDIDREYLRLKRNFFKTEIAASSKRAEHWEIKGNHLCAPRNVKSRRNHAFLTEVIKLAQRYPIKLFDVTSVKSTSSAVLPHSIYTYSLQYLSERFSCFISEHRQYERGIIIADSRMKAIDKKVAISHMSYIFGHNTGRQFTNIIEAPLFADSSLTVGLQLIDIFGSLIYGSQYNYHCKSLPGAPSYAHLSQYWDTIKSLRFSSIHEYDSHRMYGFRTIKH